MANIVFHTQRVRQALARSSTLTADLLVLFAVGGVLGVALLLAEQAAAPLNEHVEISLSLWSLPGYSLLSLARGFVAYALSLAFTLAYGTIAAHNTRAERIMLPVLDVLQAIPVLGFLPGLVLAMVDLFPAREIGLELACVLMIFTGQVWNMTFSFHSSLRGIPTAMREVARLNRLGGWRTFRLLEVPAAMIGLVWNSMMSMAGGWFFLTVNEAFTLGSRDFRLPGIGAYMNEAMHQGDVTAMIAAIVAMTAMIVLVDQIFWRPIVVWSQRFKVEEQGDPDPPESWMLALLRRSRIVSFIDQHLLSRLNFTSISRRRGRARPGSAAGARYRRALAIGRGLALLAAGAGAAWGAWTLLRLLISLPVHDAAARQDWITVVLSLLATFARTTAAVLIGALWALPVGVAIGLSPRWSNRLQPIIQVVASFPAPMLFPMVTLGLMALHVPFTIGCVGLMLLGAQWYILFNVIAGAMAIPAELREVAKMYRLYGWGRWRKLYFPSVLPYLLTGLITAAGGAWNASIVSEYVLFRGEVYRAFGLGSLISQATEAGNYPLLAAAVVTMSVFVVLLNRYFWKRLYRYSEERCSLNL